MPSLSHRVGLAHRLTERGLPAVRAQLAHPTVAGIARYVTNGGPSVQWSASAGQERADQRGDVRRGGKAESGVGRDAGDAGRERHLRRCIGRVEGGHQGIGERDDDQVGA